MMITHNDCLYHDDLLGKMLARLAEEKSGQKIGGIGLIGQCWNCPAFMADLCNSNLFEQFKPSARELNALIEQYPPVRLEIHEDLLRDGFIHPLPECRFNEYACLINVPAYNKEVYPGSDVRPFGGNWHGTDTGAAWFYAMYHKGYQFVNFPFEPDMIHAPFADNGSGHEGNSNQDLYSRSEELARQYLIDQNFMSERMGLKLRINHAKSAIYHPVRKIAGRLKHKLARLF